MILKVERRPFGRCDGWVTEGFDGIQRLTGSEAVMELSRGFVEQMS